MKIFDSTTPANSEVGGLSALGFHAVERLGFFDLNFAPCDGVLILRGDHLAWFGPVGPEQRFERPELAAIIAAAEEIAAEKFAALEAARAEVARLDREAAGDPWHRHEERVAAARAVGTVEHQIRALGLPIPAEPERVIVSRHEAAIEFIRATAPEFAPARVIASATPDDVRGKIVAGNIPLHLAALAAEVVAVEFTGAPPRGAEYGLPEMAAAGARLARYKVVAMENAAAKQPPTRQMRRYRNTGELFACDPAAGTRSATLHHSEANEPLESYELDLPLDQADLDQSQEARR